jgi:hypothetical protein
MAQNVLTVTNPNPTPPTNMSFVGAEPPDICPNFTKNSYSNPFNMSPINTGVGGTMVYTDGRPVQTIPGVGVNQSPPPFFDDQAAGVAGVGPTWTVIAGVTATLPAFKANTAALASGTGATSGGTEGTFPGTDTAPFDTPNRVGPVPASTSVAAEGAGTETLSQKVLGTAASYGLDWKEYGPNTFLPYSGAGVLTGTGADRSWQMVTAGSGPALTVGAMPTPNTSHASSLSPATAPTISATPATTLSPATIASGANTFALTVTGVGFTPQSVVYINGIPQATVFVSSTSLTVAAALKRATAGTLPVNVVTGGVIVTANSANMTYT